MPWQENAKYSINLDFKLLTHPKFKISEHAGLYMTSTLRVFALGLVGIFLPVYVFEISLSTQYQIFSGDVIVNGLLWILIYYLFRSTSTIVSIYFLTHKIFKKWGLGKSIMFSISVLITEIVLWIFAEQHLWLMFFAGLLAGVKVATYWIPYHIFFSEKLKGVDAHFGGSTAKRQSLTRVASAIAPIIGGVIIATSGFRALFLFSIFILILCGLPTLYIVSDWKHKDHYPEKIIKKALTNKKYKYLSLGFFGQGLDLSMYTIVWPVLMFLILQNYEKLGTLSGVAFFVGSIVTIFIGKVIDKKGTELVHAIGTMVNAILYVPRMFVSTVFPVYAIHMVDKANAPLFSIPCMSITYEKSLKLGRSDFMIFREIVIHSGMIVGCLLAILILFLGIHWRAVFVISFFGSLMTYFMDLDTN